MVAYCVNNEAQTTGEHEVHTYACSYFPSNRTYLGEFASCWGAITEARKHYSNVDGCYWCSNACHSR